MARNGRFSTPAGADLNSAALIIEFVGFGNRKAGRAVHSAENGRVATGTERHENGGFFVIARREPARLDLAGIGGVSPIIVARDGSAVAVMQFEGRILQDRVAKLILKRRPNRTHHHALRRGAADDQAAKQNVIAGPDSEVPQFAWQTRLEIVNLDQPDAAGIIRAGNDRGVRARRKRTDDRRFAIIAGRESALLDLLFLIAAPGIVRRDEVS